MDIDKQSDQQLESYMENTTTCLPLSGFLTKPFPCASKNYKCGQAFLDNFDADLTLSELSMLEIDKFLSIQLAQELLLSFSNAKELRKRIKMVPSGLCWKCNPLSIQRVAYCGNQAWELQSQLSNGTTLLGVILSSDKTHITMIGNRQAHPLLIFLANISSSIHNKALNNVFLLLALMPIPKFTHLKKCLCKVLTDWLLHHVINIIIDPLKRAAQYGQMMSDPIGNSKYCFTFLVAYIADVPEACVLACICNNTSYITTAMKKQFGDPFCHPTCTALATLSQLNAIKATTSSEDFAEFFKACSLYLNGIDSPFWGDWALTEPTILFSPEPLHHWWKFSHDHDLQWVMNLIDVAKLDYQFTLLQPLTGY
ncbi:hypothetical protein V8E55_002322 [Tylopilus felleus]